MGVLHNNGFLSVYILRLFDFDTKKSVVETLEMIDCMSGEWEVFSSTDWLMVAIFHLTTLARLVML